MDGIKRKKSRSKEKNLNEMKKGRKEGKSNLKMLYGVVYVDV